MTSEATAIEDVPGKDPKSFQKLRKKNKSLFTSTLNRTMSKLRLTKTQSSQNMTDQGSIGESETEQEELRGMSRKRIRRKKFSVSNRPKPKTPSFQLQYEGDKVVDENNINVEHRMKNLLTAKMKRREEIFDTSYDDDDEDSVKSRTNSMKTYRTDLDDTSLTPSRPRKSLMNGSTKSLSKTRSKLSLLGMTLKRSSRALVRDKKHDKLKQLPYYPKTEPERILISKALKDNMFFSALPVDEVELFINVLEIKQLDTGENLIDETGKGDEFFVVKEGRVSATKFATTGETRVVLPGESFGELALIHDSHQALSISAIEPSVIYTLSRKIYRKVVAYSETERIAAIKEVLLAVPLLQSLSKGEIDNLAECVQVVRFKAGDPIIVKGEIGEIFYMIKTGTVQCTKVGKKGDELKDVTLTVNDYFGERALLVNEPRAANVVAIEDVECLALNRDSFTKHLGPLKDIMNKNLSLRVLKSVPLLHELPDKRLLKLLSSMEEEEFLPGHLIIEQGSKNKKLYIILEGEVEVKVFDQSDRQKHTTVAVLKKGDFFGESSLKSTSVANAEVISIGKVICQSLQVRKNMKLLKPLTQTIKRHNNQRKKRAIEAMNKTSIALKTKEQLIPLSELTHIKTLGTGTFGRVKLVEHDKTGDTYALKILQKTFVVKFKQQKNVLHEKLVMIKSQHPFILKLFKTFVTKNCLYFLLEYVQGGELFSLLQTSGGFIKPDYAKFYAACVVDALGYLHKRKIVYRDLKPENLMIDKEGYIRVVDFGFAKKVEKKTFTLCGTPEYLAPETVKLVGHNRAVDYWAIGVLIYEMICGFSPFSDADEDSQDQIFKRIIKGNFAFPRNFPRHARLLVRKLMETNPQDRVGMFKDGPDEIKQQRWFQDIDFELLLAKEIKSPWIPKITNPTDTRHFDFFEEDDEEIVYKGSNKYWQHF